MDKFFKAVESVVAKPKAKPRRTIRQVLVDFYYFCTAHGISHAANAPTRAVRVFWIVVFIVCLTIMCIQLWFIFQKFLQYPYIVQVDIRYEQAPFPAVTVCNLNPFKASMTKKAEGIGQTLKMFSSKISQQLQGQQPWDRQKREAEEPENVTKPNILPRTPGARYYPVYSDCICEILEKVDRTQGSCFSASKGTFSKDFQYPRNKYRKSKCICDYDPKYNSPWPCYPAITWKSNMCIHCDKYGHCPMRFWDTNQHIGSVHHCLCHDEFNHCVALDLDKEIPSLHEQPHPEVETETITPVSTTTTTTPAPEVVEALGFEETHDELATKAKGKENLVFAVAGVPEEEKVRLSYSKKEFILMCSFGGYDCDESDFKLHIDPVYGNCYTFNHNVTREPPLIAVRAGENYDYLPTTEAMGVRVGVHSPSVVPFPDAFGYSAPRKFSRLPYPYGDCLEDMEKAKVDFIYEGEYTVEGCYRSCFQNELIKMCGCGDPRFPTGVHASPCSVSNATARQCLDNQTSMMGSFGATLECYCNQPCKEDAFYVTWSSSLWPSPRTQVANCASGDEMCIEEYRFNAALIQIYYEQLNFEMMEEKPVYVIANLLADFGGQLGLWLGLSVISGLEFLMLIYDLCMTSYLDRKERKESLKQSAFNPDEVKNCLCDCNTEELVAQQAADQIFASAFARKLANTSYGEELIHPKA